MQLTNAKNAAGKALCAARRATKGPNYRHIFVRSYSDLIFEKPRPQKNNYPAELRGLLDEANAVRHRILASRALVYWLVCCNLVLGVLILAAAFSGHLKGAIILGAILLALSALISFFVARRTGPSIYGAACKLDASAGLQDRLSTTIHFAGEEKPDSMVLSQRRDSLARLKGINARALFPLQMPLNARRTAALALVAVGLFAYRIKYGPPGLMLAHKVSRSHLSETVSSPLARVIESTPLYVPDRPKIDVLDAEAAAAAAGTAEKAGKELNSFPPATLPGANGSGIGQQNSRGLNPAESEANAHGSASQNQSQPNDTSHSDSTQESRGQSVPDQNSPKTASEGKSPSTGQSKANAQNSKAGSQSLGQQIVQALKEMMGNIMGQDASQSPAPPSPQSPGSTAQGQGGQAPESTGKLSQQPTANDAKAKETQGSSGKHSGAGNGTEQQVVQKPTEQGTSAPSDLIPERVPLDATDFRVQTHPRAMPGPGSSEVPLTHASLTGTASTNGAEQENIPMRYRQYVQRYFDQRQK
jgi:hypothetical protein